MTATPPTPRKRAPGGGRKAKSLPRHMVQVRCSDEDFEKYIFPLTPEERAEKFIPAADTNPGNTIP